MVQWLRVHLPMQRTRVLLWEIPRATGQLSLCATITEPTCHTACVLPQEKPLSEKPVHHNKDPVQSKIMFKNSFEKKGNVCVFFFFKAHQYNLLEWGS